jgi:hypothetical protein
MEDNLVKFNSDRKFIDLPNHPYLPNVTRKAKVHETNPNYHNKFVELVVDVFHYNEDGVLIESMSGAKGRCRLMADNNDIVSTQTGDEIPKDAKGSYITQTINGVLTYPANSARNFDYLWYLVNIAKVMTMEEAEDLYITKRVEKINLKLYGQ